MESPGIEPGSKQATKELSTRLFPDWFFDAAQGQEQPHNAYLLCCQEAPEACANLGLFLRFPLIDRHKPRLSRGIQPPCLTGTWHYLTLIQIMQLKRSYFRRLKVLEHGLTRFVPISACLLFNSTCCQNQSTPFFSIQYSENTKKFSLQSVQI